MVLLRICGALLKTSLERPWNLMGALKKLHRSIVIQCHTPAHQWPTKSRVFAPVVDDLACSYKNEGSIPFTRSTLFLSKFAVFPGTVIRVSYEAPRISPVFRGFPSRNRNRGSGADGPTDGLALPLILRWVNLILIDHRHPQNYSAL